MISIGHFAAPAADATISQHLAAAQEAERAQNYPAASREYEEILKTQPASPLIRQSLAVTYHLQNRYPEAIAEFARALRLDATLWGSYLFLGMDYYKTNQFSLALAPLEKSISLNAKMAEPEARFWLAVSHSALDQPELAVRDLRRDLELRPNDIDVLYYLAKAYDQAGGALFQRLGRADPRSAAVSLLEAEHFMEENREDLAKLRYRNALKLRPDFAGWIPPSAVVANAAQASPDLPISASDAQATLDLANLLSATGQAAPALAILQSLVREKAADAKAAGILLLAEARLTSLHEKPDAASRSKVSEVAIGWELCQQGRFREAVQPLAHAAEKDPRPALQLLLGKAYGESSDWAASESHLQKILLSDPRNIDALLLLGRAYKGQAEATLQKMIAIDADSYGVHELLGKRHEEKTEFDLAVQEYQATLAKRPDLAGIRYAIGNVYRKMSRFEEAEKWLTEELSRNPYHGLAHFRLGSIYTEQGKPEAAIPHLEEALRSHPLLTDAQLDLGRAYTAVGRYDDAAATLKRVVRTDPDNDRVHYLLSLAYSKQGRRADAQTELAAYQRLTRDRLQRTQEDVKDAGTSVDH